jgi:hypothetical protein
MSGPGLSGILLVLGLVVLVVFVLGVFLWARARRSRSSKDPDALIQDQIKEQILWRAMAQGGRITVAEAAAHGGQAPEEVERALMMLVAEGQANAEAGEGGEIVYLVDSGSDGAAGAGEGEAGG